MFPFDFKNENSKAQKGVRFAFKKHQKEIMLQKRAEMNN